MLRRTPMKRTPFRSKMRPEREALDEARTRVAAAGGPSLLELEARFVRSNCRERSGAPLTPIRQPAPSETVFRPSPKREYVRSEALMRAYRALPCQHCGAEGEAAGVCGAHANWGMGKGMGVKADDNCAASLCFECHRLLDQGKSWTDETKRRIWASAHIKTVAKLVALNLWPVGMPKPDTTLAAEWVANVPRETL